MKVCSKCKTSKELVCFTKYTRKNGREEYTSECKECEGIRRRARNKDLVNQKRREYVARNPELIKKINCKYQKENKDKVNEAHREWYAKNVDKLAEQRKSQNERTRIWARIYTKKEDVMFKKRANAVLNYHVKRGNILKPTKCQECGEAKRLEGHHADYSKPLAVVWVCRTCHVFIHRSTGLVDSGS